MGFGLRRPPPLPTLEGSLGRKAGPAVAAGTGAVRPATMALPAGRAVVDGGWARSASVAGRRQGRHHRGTKEEESADGCWSEVEDNRREVRLLSCCGEESSVGI